MIKLVDLVVQEELTQQRSSKCSLEEQVAAHSEVDSEEAVHLDSTLEKLVAPVDHKPFSLPDSQVELKAFPVE
jgi:hypothetical protein